MARNIFLKYLKNLSCFKHFLLFIAIFGCAHQEAREEKLKNPLLEKYRRMRSADWKSFSQQQQKRRRAPLPPSTSIEHLKENVIFQQVTQIYCFKVRADENKCNKIRYLALLYCGEINHESKIKRYRKCLENKVGN